MSLTFGQIMLADILPPDVYRAGDPIDKSSIKDILREVALKYPERYEEISYKLMRFGSDAAISTGGASFSIKDLDTPPKVAEKLNTLRGEIGNILDTVPDNEQNDAIIAAVRKYQKTLPSETVSEASALNNPLSKQLKGAGRGSPASLARLIAGDLLYADGQNNAIPVPILNSYSSGLSPAEHFASTFGARGGVLGAKLGVGQSGFLAKTLQAASHRAMVAGLDHKDNPDEPDTAVQRGLPVNTNDEDNVGALLAQPFGPYKRNTPLTPKIMQHLEDLGFDEILVRSPLTTRAPGGSVYARDLGYNENNRLPDIGSNPGLVAASALAEPLTQGALSSKHKGGLANEKTMISGFELVERLVNTPQEFREAATHSQLDGTVEKIEEAPQGGKYLFVNGQQHYVLPYVDILVKPGDKVEAGDPLTEGPINPREVVKHKGIGEGGRQVVNQFYSAMKGFTSATHRRNVELVVKGLLDRVNMTEEYGDYAPDDLVPYSEIAAKWQPRPGFKLAPITSAQNKYLEQPVLHYSIGTRITPSVTNKLKKFGVNQIAVHDKPPPFESEVVRGVDLLQSDPDWMTRQLGTGLQKGLLEGAHRGAISDEGSASFVPARARALDFSVNDQFTLRPPE